MSGDLKALGAQDLSALAVEELIMKWRQHLTERVPDHLPKSLLARLLSYKLQVEQHGGLSKKAAAYLKVIEIDLREGLTPKTPYVESNQLKPGSQLAREHEGILHRVTVLKGGYTWEGKTFTSLSAVAKAITGTNWNGHRFFGLKQKTKFVAEIMT
jgi:Protein of unknown function (DUF2924)